jgi:hypothetical protein
LGADGEEESVFYECLPPSWFKRNQRLKARRLRRRRVCKLHHFGGGLATAQCGHSSMHMSTACPAVSSKATEGVEAGGSSTATSEGGQSCNFHADGSGCTQNRWRLWDWVKFILTMLLVPFVSAGACGAAFGKACHHACHTVCC